MRNNENFEIDCYPIRGVTLVDKSGVWWCTATFAEPVTLKNGEELRVTYTIYTIYTIKANDTMTARVRKVISRLISSILKVFNVYQ